MCMVGKLTDTAGTSAGADPEVVDDAVVDWG